MSRIKAPQNLPLLVKHKFVQARLDKEIDYFPTQVTVIPAKNIPFQLRYSPALASKPKAAPHDPAKPHKVFNPFENPPPGIRITDIGSSHFLVLNKFAIVPEHFILVTSTFKAQTHVLEKVDLEATLACIGAYEAARRKEGEVGHGDGEFGGGDGLYAFFNCGNHSGASQPHRHIQMLPIARMRDGLEDDTSWSILADRLTSSKAPFKTFAEKIDLEISGEELHAVYLRLYHEACKAVDAYLGEESKVGEVENDGEAKISYNMAMMKDTLVILPRLAEGGKVLGEDGSSLGGLSLNGTVLAGTALAKNELEWHGLQKDPKGFESLLRSIGIPSDEAERGCIY